MLARHLDGTTSVVARQADPGQEGASRARPVATASSSTEASARVTGAGCVVPYTASDDGRRSARDRLHACARGPARSDAPHGKFSAGVIRLKAGRYHLGFAVRRVGDGRTRRRPRHAGRPQGTVQWPMRARVARAASAWARRDTPFSPRSILLDRQRGPADLDARPEPQARSERAAARRDRAGVGRGEGHARHLPASHHGGAGDRAGARRRGAGRGPLRPRGVPVRQGAQAVGARLRRLREPDRRRASSTGRSTSSRRCTTAPPGGG